MGRAMKHVPPGKGDPAPDPPGVWDKEAVEGPNWRKIQNLLEETTEIAEIDWAYRHLIPRRNAIWAELAGLGVTQGRMRRAYAIDKKPITSHVGVKNVLNRLGVETKPMQRPPREDEE